ncbi:transmembrane protein (macronuclear) [Tetrahymena thermophila SB210]|uniref:Transmembrane protein n=1 Tax=Tetrahymena thermophila (strain SB210) TaxID=312017 RepID=Q23I82_TETTS|nr:transmembrane protein [Tetrahymena thermophila SB210]EAR96235.2 transmembrane protein [Tetrahymena thermophila SB210]|eukprot:XP_001016480.2 transmembrane protein [Tetrahymena thermophila SB210]
MTDVIQQQDSSYEKNILMQFYGCNNLLLKNSSFKKNIGGVILKVSNQIQQDNNIIKLLNDVFNIDNLQVQKNSQPQMASIIQIQSSNVYIKDMDFSQNKGNCLAYGSQKCEINNSTFYDNRALDGGAIYFYGITNYIKIQNSTFRQNIAQGSGGSLLFEELNQNCLIIFDNKTKIISNAAKIGGGLRILSSQLDYQLPTGFPFKQNVCSNKAEIYGDDSTYNIQSILINKYKSLSNSDQNKNYTFQFENIQQTQLNSNYSGVIQIENFMSGGKIQLQIYFLDNYKRKINFSKDLLRQNKYPTRIQKELMELQINIESISSTNTQLIGDKQVNYLLYDEETSSFILTDLTISASIESQFNFKISTSMENIYSNFYPYLMVINFRPCILGEIVQSITSSIKVCQYCTLGTYSFEKPQSIPSSNLNQTQNNNTQQYLSNQCKLCPSSALFCEGNQIKLKNGYWRPNQTTDEIIQCNQVMNFCLPEESSSSIEGCAEGYVGALCSECDLQSKIWNKKGHMYAPSILKGVCSECSNMPLDFIQRQQ